MKPNLLLNVVLSETVGRFTFADVLSENIHSLTGQTIRVDTSKEALWEARAYLTKWERAQRRAANKGVVLRRFPLYYNRMWPELAARIASHLDANWRDQYSHVLAAQKFGVRMADIQRVFVTIKQDDVRVSGSAANRERARAVNQDSHQRYITAILRGKIQF